MLIRGGNEAQAMLLLAKGAHVNPSYNTYETPLF